MFRKIVAGISGNFPPKFVSDRLMPWASLVLVALGAFWAIHEYRNDLAIARVAATIELNKSYAVKLTSLKAEFAQAVAPTVLRARCQFIADSVDAGKISATPDDQLNCVSIDETTLRFIQSVELKGDLRQRGRNYIFAQVGKEKLSTKQANNLAQLSLFLRSVIICVEHGNCEAATAVALFAREMVEFVNMTCPFDQQLAQGGQTVGEEIANFLIGQNVHKNIYWSLDANREKLFACDSLRKLER